MAFGKQKPQLDPVAKHRTSHRGRALRRLKALMEETGLTTGRVSH